MSSGIFKKALSLIFADDPSDSLRRISKKDRPLKTLTERELIELESEIGRTVFGPLPANVVRREFFNLDEHTWIWHEEIKVSDGTTQQITTRYELQPRGVLKVQPGPKYTYLDGEELRNLVLATKEYYERTTRQLYGHDPQPNRPL
ncbi:hypothetical protein B7Y94_00590 [Candidatus Saccharibacteria bacterium 32-49-12]|nr:MAG: hypothetical protein B7Y94_00590 [Candidatus Saccharibacteria bacterium 32-49-12]